MNALDGQMADVLRRAQEIQEGADLFGDAREIEAFLRAAEEIGISRDATMRALQERLALTRMQFNVGDFVYAKGGDGFYYVALIQSMDETTAKVRFMHGSDDVVSLAALVRFSMTPGSKVQYLWMGWWYQCEIIRLNQDSRSATVRCWGFEYTVPFEHIRLAVERPRNVSRPMLWAVGVACGTGGVVLGALITWLASR